MKTVKFVVDHAAWDDGDFVVTIRPCYELSWKSIPIGPILSKGGAREVAEWLQNALPDLWTIFINIAAEAEGASGRTPLLEEK